MPTLPSRQQLDLVINALVLARKASSAIDTALGLPAKDRAQLEEDLDAVRHDLGQLVNQMAGSVPGASGLGRRPEVRMAAGVVEFVARQGAAQLGAVAGIADTLRSGGDSRTLAQKVERHLAQEGIASREDLAEALKMDPSSNRFREALERALGSGQAEWYGPDVYGVPRSRLEGMVAAQPEPDPDAAAEPEAQPESEGNGGTLSRAVGELESSLAELGRSLRDADAGVDPAPGDLPAG